MMDLTFVPPDDNTLLPDCIENLLLIILSLKEDVSKQSRMAKLFIQYLDNTQNLINFFRADRTCDWCAHLSSLKKMLPVFAASGHRNYAKSGRLYLQLTYQ